MVGMSESQFFPAFATCIVAPGVMEDPELKDFLGEKLRKELESLADERFGAGSWSTLGNFRVQSMKFEYINDETGETIELVRVIARESFAESGYGVWSA